MTVWGLQQYQEGLTIHFIPGGHEPAWRRSDGNSMNSREIVERGEKQNDAKISVTKWQKSRKWNKAAVQVIPSHHWNIQSIGPDLQISFSLENWDQDKDRIITMEV